MTRPSSPGCRRRRSPRPPTPPRNAGWPANTSCLSRTPRSSRFSPACRTAPRERRCSTPAGRARNRVDPNDTRATIAQIAMLRAQKAKLLGFDSWADYVLQDQMAKTPETALAFMRQLGRPVAAEQKREAAELQDQIKADGGDFALKPWDWGPLFGAAAQGQVRPEPGRAEAVFRDQQGADRRRVLRRQPALRLDLQAPHRPARLSPRRDDL